MGLARWQQHGAFAYPKKSSPKCRLRLVGSELLRCRRRCHRAIANRCPRKAVCVAPQDPSVMQQMQQMQQGGMPNAQQIQQAQQQEAQREEMRTGIIEKVLTMDAN